MQETPKNPKNSTNVDNTTTYTAQTYKGDLHREKPQTNMAKNDQGNIPKSKKLTYLEETTRRHTNVSHLTSEHAH